MKNRYFRHIKGFVGSSENIDMMQFLPDGKVFAILKDGSVDPEPYTGLYSIASAEMLVEAGEWVEIEKESTGIQRINTCKIIKDGVEIWSDEIVYDHTDSVREYEKNLDREMTDNEIIEWIMNSDSF